MKSKYLYAVLAITVIAAVLVSYFQLRPKAPNKPVVAIVTTLSHPALDSVSLGFKSSLDQSFATLDFNAEGNVQQANMIARQIAQNPQIVGILAIGTLAAQTVAKVEKNRAIVIAAVSEPQTIMPAHPAENLCGMTDAIDASYQINTILELLPDTKSIALLYSPHEANSAFMVEALGKHAKSKNLRVELVGVQEAQQIASASMRACQISDAVLIPLDNQLVASMPAVIKATKNMSCPIITSNESPIHQGATIAFGVDYEKSGQEAGKIMAQVLAAQKTPQEIGFIKPADVEIFINQRVAQEKSIKINANIKSNIIVLNGEK